MVSLRIGLAMTAAALCALAAPASAHTVMGGESLSSIAAANGLTTEELAAANGLSSDGSLLEGESIYVPYPSGAGAGDPAAGGNGGSGGGEASGGYLVQPGDTLSAIAAREGLSTEGLAAANGLDPAGVL